MYMNKLFLWIAAASAIVLQSCEKTDGIQDEIDSLRDRVAALESKVGQVNSGIEALRLLMDESTVIVGVTFDETKKEYVIEFSDKSGTSTSCSVLSAEKIDAVDRNILRVAFYQMAFSKDVHPAIVIDEAVKLSQELSNDVSFKFINGILDAARKDLERK